MRGPLFDCSGDAILLRVPGVGRFLVGADGTVAVERSPGATDDDLRCFGDEVVAAARAFVAGAVVLRAASVAFERGAVAVCGVSASGKSALAAALAQRGHAVLADAVTVLSAESGGHAIASTAPEVVVVWPDVAAELALDPAAGHADNVTGSNSRAGTSA
jgi:hypothetical protein